jgi:hypothetical protein
MIQTSSPVTDWRRGLRSVPAQSKQGRRLGRVANSKARRDLLEHGRIFETQRTVREPHLVFDAMKILNMLILVN